MINKVTATSTVVNTQPAVPPNLSDSEICPLSFVFSEIYRRYADLNFEVFGGFSPYLSGSNKRTLGNYIANDELLMSSSGGIANDEATFMYGLCEVMKPKNILVIGNSYGFSTLFLSLVNPNANLVAFDKFRTEGIKVTQKLLDGLHHKNVIQASTPDDIPSIVSNYFPEKKIDFVLVDAVHTNEMQTAEFDVLKPYLNDNSIIIFHDVVSCDLLDSYHFLEKSNPNRIFRLMHKTSTGLALCLTGAASEYLINYLNYFSAKEDRIFKFHAMMLKNSSDACTRIFEKFESDLRFPPHPQL
jgi:predicted O-methyltransferase YrrM